MGMYRFKNAMNDVIDEREFGDHEAATTWAVENDELDEDVMRVEYQDEQQAWRWAGPLPL